MAAITSQTLQQVLFEARFEGVKDFNLTIGGDTESGAVEITITPQGKAGRTVSLAVTDNTVEMTARSLWNGKKPDAPAAETPKAAKPKAEKAPKPAPAAPKSPKKSGK